MPPIEEVDLIDEAVYLEASDYNRAGRLESVDLPVALACRWTENVTFVGGADVDTESIVAQVYVNQELILGSVVWHGKLSDFPKDWENIAPSEIMEVVGFHKQEDVKGDCVRMWADLARYKDELPEVAD